MGTYHKPHTILVWVYCEMCEQTTQTLMGRKAALQFLQFGVGKKRSDPIILNHLFCPDLIEE